MKIFISNLFFFIFITIALFSCKKNNSEPELAPAFKVGIVTENMNHVIYNPPLSVVAPPDSFATVYLDIDDNGYNDIYLASFHQMGPEGDTVLRSIVSAPVTYYINDFKIRDTLFRCDLYVNDSNYIYTYYNQFASYNCIYPGHDTVYNSYWKKYYYPVIHSRGTLVEDNLSWLENYQILAFHDISEFVIWHNGIFYTQKWDVNRDYWNNVDEKYILIKKEKPFENYYGWIKLSIKNYNQILIHEYAFENY